VNFKETYQRNCQSSHF